MKSVRYFLIAIVAMGISGVRADAPPSAPSPQSAGFSASRLQRLTDKFEGDVRSGVIPGAVVLIVRNGKVAYFKAFGDRDRAAGAAMQPDSIFRIASMTKPVTTVAALMLVEEGRLQLADPVSRYLPELKQLQVGVEKTDAASGERTLLLEPARREITVQDLMRHTSGMTYGPFGDSLVQRAYRAANAMDDQQTNAEMLEKLSKLPLAYQPGTVFEYGMSTDVLGRIVEVISGKDLNQFVAERIAKPLRLANTSFLLNAAQTAKLAEPQRDKNNAPIVVGYNPARPPKWFSGGGGLLSTAEDYARFSQMLLNGGELDGVRLLARKTVELMTSDHLPPDVGYGPFALELGLTAPLPQLGQGYGLGVGVRKDQGRSPVAGSIGDYFWGGATGPYFWIDPKEQLIAIMMLQELNAQRRTYYRSVMRNLVYQALE